MLILDLIPNFWIEAFGYKLSHQKPGGGGGYPLFAPTKAIIYALKKFGWFYTLPSFFIFSICFQLWGYVNFNIQHDIFIQYFRMFWDVLMELLLELLPQMKINPTTWIAKASFIEYTGKYRKCTIYKLFIMYIIRFCFELNAYIPYTNFFGVGCLRCQLQICSICAQWPGSVHNSRIRRESAWCQKLESSIYLSFEMCTHIWL